MHPCTPSKGNYPLSFINGRDRQFTALLLKRLIAPDKLFHRHGRTGHITGNDHAFQHASHILQRKHYRQRYRHLIARAADYDRSRSVEPPLAPLFHKRQHNQGKAGYSAGGESPLSQLGKHHRRGYKLLNNRNRL